MGCANPLNASVFFFPLPSLGRRGNRWSSFEPITQSDPLIITNLPESLIWGLPNCAVCTTWRSSLSCRVFAFFSMCVQDREVERRRKWQKRERHRKECLCTFASLSLGIFYHKTSLWAGQRSGNTGNDSQRLHLYLPSPHTFAHCLSRVRARLMPPSHADSSTCLEHYTVGELGQLSKMSRSLPLQGMHHNASLLSWKHIKH